MLVLKLAYVKEMRKNVFKKVLILFSIIGMLSMASVFAVDLNNSTNNTTTNQTIQNEIAVEAQGQIAAVQTNTQGQGISNHDIGLLAVALSTGLACIGAGIAVAVVASSAIGAISENPNLLGKTIIFAGLAEGIAIYGLIISIMILNKI